MERSRWGYTVFQLFKAECGGTCSSGSQAGPSTGIKGGRKSTMAHSTSTDRNQFHGLHVSTKTFVSFHSSTKNISFVYTLTAIQIFHLYCPCALADFERLCVASPPNLSQSAAAMIVFLITSFLVTKLN